MSESLRTKALHAAVVICAADWWKSKRPVGWTVQQHLANKTINCQPGVETHLASAAGEAVSNAIKSDDRLKS